MKATLEENKALVLKAFDTLFNQRDYLSAEKFWSPKYVQHSAHIEAGREGLFNLVRSLPPTTRWEHGLVLAEGDYVTVHSRYSGNDPATPWVVADFVRMEDGVLAEHWDVIQDEVTREQSKSRMPMFGASFADPDGKPTPDPLTKTEAIHIVGPLYKALNRPCEKDVKALLAEACNPDYRSYSTNQESLGREELAEVFKMIGTAIPDLSWAIEDITVFGDQIVVRGEASGTPTGSVFGVEPTGRSFTTMSIDVFTVKNRKLSRAYHTENWVGAIAQVKGVETL